MRRPLLALAACVLSGCALLSQSPDRTHGFRAATIRMESGPLAGQDLAYRIRVPEDLADDERVPLLLFLHGAGERGSGGASR